MVDSTDEVVLWGDGSPSREFLYVDDCVEGLLLAAEHYDGAEPVNLGTGVETTIRELAETIADVTGFEGEIVWDTSMPNGQPRRSLDASRAAELFGFRSSTSLREGIERTVAWYHAHALAVTAARALAPFVALAWVVAATVAAAAGGYEQAPWWLLLLNQLLLAPVLVGAAWWLGRTVAGWVEPSRRRLRSCSCPCSARPTPTRSCATRTSTAFSPRRSVSRTVGASPPRSASTRSRARRHETAITRRRGRCSRLGVMAVAALSHGIGLDVSKDAFDLNIAGREYTWSNRTLRVAPARGRNRRRPAVAADGAPARDLVRDLHPRLRSVAERERRRRLVLRRVRSCTPRRSPCSSPPCRSSCRHSRRDSSVRRRPSGSRARRGGARAGRAAAPGSRSGRRA